jgi:hypothetical protein
VGGGAAGGSFFSLSGPSARATFAGPAFAAAGGSFTFIGGSVVRVDGGAHLVGTSPAPLFILDHVSSFIDNTDAALLFSGSSTSLAGGLLEMRSVVEVGGAATSAPIVSLMGASLSAGNALVNLADSGIDVADCYLLEMVGSTLTVSGPLLRLVNGQVDTLEMLAMDATSTLTLSGPLGELGQATLTSIGDLLPVKDGARIISSAPAPLVALNVAALTVGGSIFGLRGRSSQTASEVADGVNLTLGTDQPITHPTVWVDAVGSTVSANHAVALDTALLAASAPLLSLRAGSTMTSSFDAIQLTTAAKLTSPGPLVALDAGQLTVASGAVLNVANGSLVRVTGDLFALANGSILRTNNGPLVRVSGNSVLNVTGSLIAFGSGPASQVQVTNSVCGTSCSTFGGIPVHFVNGASSSNVTIGPNAIKNPGLGTFSPSGPTAAAILLDGPSSKVTIIAP